jgi:transposase
VFSGECFQKIFLQYGQYIGTLPHGRKMALLRLYMMRGKKIKGNKRHVIVDTLGLLLVVVVHSAKIQDRTGAQQVFRRLYMKCIDLKRVWADEGYTGTLIGWVQDLCSTVVEIVKRTEQHAFVVLPRRWVVERTFSWLTGRGDYLKTMRD